jgi:hypothetical protein
MSKHLRFGRLLGLLALMLTLSFAWAQGQNLSSEKVLSQIMFFAADNPGGTGAAELFEDVEGTVDQTTMVVSIEFPYRYSSMEPDAIGSNTLMASFKSSKFSNVFFTKGSATDLMDAGWREDQEIGQGYGTEENAPWIIAENDFWYMDGEVLTVEAENHSYVYYTLDVTFGAPSTKNSIVSMIADWEKDWSTNCAALWTMGSVDAVIDGLNITVNVPFGTDLENVFLYFVTNDPFTSAYLGAAPTTPIAPAPDPNSFWFNADLSNLTTGIKIYVYSQAYHVGDADNAALRKIYTVKAVVGVASELDEMKQLVFKASPVNPGLPSDVVATLDPLTQTWTATVPYGVNIAGLKASWETSEFANMFNGNPLAMPAPQEICSATVLVSSSYPGRPHSKEWCDAWIADHPNEAIHPLCQKWYDGDDDDDDDDVTPPPVYITLGDQFDLDDCGTNGLGASFWVQAEDDSEVSEYPFCITNAACSKAALLTSIWGSWEKYSACELAYTGKVQGTINGTAKTITFAVPYGVASVEILSAPATPYTYSTFATTNRAAGTDLSDGNKLKITSQCGSDFFTEYTVVLVPGAKSSAKELTAFGFHWDENTGLGFDWNETDYIVEPGDAGWDAVNRRITVTVPYVTDLHHMVAYFTMSDYSCVSIANTNGNVPQVSDETINDHSNTLTYVVTAEDGTEERYQVMVVKEPVSSDKSLSAFELNCLPYCRGLYIHDHHYPPSSPDYGKRRNCYDVYGEDLVTIDGTNITVSVKNGTDVTELRFDFLLGSELVDNVTISNGDINKNDFDAHVWGMADFTSPVTITVTAQDYSKTVYTVTVVERAANSDKVITDYWFLASENMIGINDATVANGAVEIDQATRVITVHLPFGSDVTDLVAGFELNDGENSFPGGAVLTHSEDGQEVQESDVTSNNFFHQVAYTVFAEDCSTLEYFVNVIVDPNEGNDILAMKLEGMEYAECDYEAVAFTKWVEGPANEFTMHVPFGTDLEHLQLTPTLSPGATIEPALDGLVALEEDVPFMLTVTAENGVSTQVYYLTIVVDAPLTGAQMLTFGFEAENNDALATDRWTAVPINQTTFRIDVKVPYAIDLATEKLVATFTSSPMSCVYINGVKWTAEDLQHSGVSENLYDDALTYTVKAQNGDETYYNVYVTKDAPLTEKSLTMFNLTDITYCPGVEMTPATFKIPGTGTTAIAVSVKNGMPLTAVKYSFEVSATATVKLGSVVLPKVGNTVTGTADFTSPVVFSVYAEDGSKQDYTVTVTPRAANSKKQLTKYWLTASPTNPFTGADVLGTINETAKTVDVWVPWGTSVTSLVASFELNNEANTFPGGVVMTHSEDKQYVQVSGVTANDFTDPVAYTVIAEDCSTVEYFVTVRMTPNTDTGISGFAFSYTDCGCDLTTKIDPYARRIYITVPSTVNISSLAPSDIVITPAIGTRPAATVSPKVGVAQNWTTGPIKYTVTAPDGVTKADWWVSVTNPKCTDTDIVAFSLPDAQVSPADIVPGFGQPVTIDAVNHTIHVYVKKGINLASVKYERTLPCGATICCVGGNCQDNRFMDFSQGGCHTCVVTAQDQTVTQEWTICVEELDGGEPEVTTWSVMAMNCADSVAVQSNELGRVFIVNEAAINMNVTPEQCTPMYDLFDWTGTGANSVSKLVANRMGAWATVTAVDTPVYIKTNGLYSGMYWAFAVDASGNVSCISTEKLFLDMCDVTVATLCDLRNQPDVWRYTVAQEIVVTHEEPRTSGGNWIFAQSADCGILIEDRVDALPSYAVGTGLTGLKGMLDKSGPMMKLIPVCCYEPTKSSTGNVVTPKSMTYSSFLATALNGSHVYESMLVKINKPLKLNGTGNWTLNSLYGTKDVAATEWADVIATPLANVDYLKTATALPTVQSFFTGLRFDVKPDATEYGRLVPLKKAHIEAATAPILFANPNPAMVGDLLPGECKPVTIQIVNEGVGNATITALYLDDASATDEFQLVPSAEVAVPFTIGGWSSKSVVVKFCPLDEGFETTNLIVEYGVGKTLVVPINGTPLVIVDMPACQTFNPPFPGASDFGASYQGWVSPASNLTDLQNYVSTAWVNYDGSPVMNMRPRQVINGVRQTTYLVTPGYNVTGSDPVIQWVEANSSNAWTGAKVSPRNLYISTDGSNWTLVDTYTSADLPDAFTGEGWRKQIYSLKDYVGETIWWKFELISNNTATGYEYSYWCLDNICVQQRVTEPIISASPNPGEFGGVQVGATGTLTFAVKNLGVSILKIKNVSVAGEGFTKVDTNTYPFEVTDGPGTWAYTTGATGSVLNFNVEFKPTEIGVKTGTLTITYGLYSDMLLEIPLSGEGLSCSTAAVANLGQNWAPSQNTWFKYTAEKFSVVEVTSCDPHQDLVTDEYAWDTHLYLYSDCDGTLLGDNDDMEAACVYNRASSSVQVVMEAGQTIYIFWPLEFPTALYAYDGFYFNINATYPIDGDVCENAIPLTLPVVNHFGTTVGFADDYNISPCSPFSNYMDGNDKVYSITIPYEGYLTASLLGAYGSIHVLDMCPKEELEKFHCKAFVGGPNGGQFEKKIAEGTYFVIISTWSPPQTVDYLLNMSFRGTGVDDNALNSKLSVYPNPNTGRFTVSISNPEATDMTIELVGINGQVVYRNEVKSAYSHTEEINASTFAKGVYYLKVNDASGVKIEKVVVQ